MVTGCAKVLLVSRRPHICAQVRLSLESGPGLVVVGEAGNYVSALAIAAAERPDFIVVDVEADDERGLDHISDLVRVTKHVLVIADICEETMLKRVRRAGATDLVPREQVVAAIMKRRLQPQRIVPLTEQEMVVCDLVSSGFSNKKIAEHLFISEAVVYEALVSILRKLKVRDRFELRIYTLYKGLASPE